MVQARKKSTAGRNAQIARILHGALKTALMPLGSFRRDTMMSTLSETIIPVASVATYNGKAMKFWGFGGWPLYRGRSILDKEPLTIRWIDGFESGSIFWDIGANIGAFSVYAAVAHSTKTYAFEPSAANAAVLCKNIELNRADDLITAFPVALSDQTKLDTLHMVSTAAGNTGGQFSEKETRERNIFKQSCLGFSMDDFVKMYAVPVPNYIKIDVDGIELRILKGGDKTLKNPALRSLILEADITSQDYGDIKNFLAGYGLEEGESEPTVQGRAHVRNIIFAR